MVTYLANLESDANEPWSHFVFTSNAADYRVVINLEKSKGGPLKSRISAIFQKRKSSENQEISKSGLPGLLGLLDLLDLGGLGG